MPIFVGKIENPFYQYPAIASSSPDPNANTFKSRLPLGIPYCWPFPRSVYCQKVQFKSQADELQIVLEHPPEGVEAGFEV
jgi:hypothetical protein